MREAYNPEIPGAVPGARICSIWRDKMDMWDRVDVNGKPSDQELKERAKCHANGEYIVKICRSCGMLWNAHNGKTDDAKIVDKCGYCPRAND